MLILIFAAVLRSAAQESSAGAQPAFGVVSSGNSEGRMSVPGPVSDSSYSVTFSSETPRTNYLNAGLTLGTAYDSNVVVNGSKPVSDFSYSLLPSISLQQSRARARWDLTYAPGFTFYQRTSAYNAANHNLLANLEYRLSPHTTFIVGEQFSRTSSFFNQIGQDLTLTPEASHASQPNVIVPIAEQISNSTRATLSYQFGSNAMVGGTGSFSLLNYPNPSQAQGISDSTGKQLGMFYTHRLSGRHYIGASYDFQNLQTHPNHIQTQVQSVLFFYTLNPNSAISLAIFAGPEHSHTYDVLVPASNMWSPAIGGSFNWQGEHRSFGASVAHRVTPGGGLSSATRATIADAAFRQRVSKNVSAILSGQYTTSDILNPLGGLSPGGHLISGTFSAQRPLGEHVNLALGYTQLHQSYPSIPSVSSVPGRSHAWVSVSYQFQRPLGR